LISSHWI